MNPTTTCSAANGNIVWQLMSMNYDEVVMKRLHRVQHVHQLPQPPVIAAIEGKGNSLEIQLVLIVDLVLRGLDGLDFPFDDDVGEVFAHFRELGCGWRIFQ